MAELMVFYKGALSYNTLNVMPIPELMHWHNIAAQINRDRRLEAERAKRGF